MPSQIAYIWLPAMASVSSSLPAWYLGEVAMVQVIGSLLFTWEPWIVLVLAQLYRHLGHEPTAGYSCFCISNKFKNIFLILNWKYIKQLSFLEMKSVANITMCSMEVESSGTTDRRAKAQSWEFILKEGSRSLFSPSKITVFIPHDGNLFLMKY